MRLGTVSVAAAAQKSKFLVCRKGQAETNREQWSHTHPSFDQGRDYLYQVSVQTQGVGGQLTGQQMWQVGKWTLADPTRGCLFEVPLA